MLYPTSIPTLQQPLKMPHFHSIECCENPAPCFKAGPQQQPQLFVPACSTSYPLEFFSKPEMEGETGEGRQNDPRISAILMQSSRADAAEGSCCVKPVSARPLASLSGQTQAVSHGHSCSLHLPREPSVPEPRCPGRELSGSCPTSHLDRHKVHGRA